MPELSYHIDPDEGDPIGHRFALYGGALVGGGVITSHRMKAIISIRLGQHAISMPWMMRGFLYERRNKMMVLGHYGLN